MTAAELSPASVRASVPPPVSVRPPGEEPAALTTEDVLRDEEVERARVFFRVILVLAIAVDAFLPFLPAAPWVRIVAAVFCSIEAIVCVYVLLAIRDVARYTGRLITAVGAWSAIAGVFVIYVVGLFSAGAMLLCLGIYFFGMSQSRVTARVVYAVVSGLYLLGSVALAVGALPDAGFFRIEGVPAMTVWYQVVMSQAVFAVTFYLARSSRRATEGAVDRMKRANAEIHQRDAQLAEARGELDRALRAGEGRHTGETLGSYRLGDVVGRGGMGEVYAARDLRTQQPVAVKLLHPNMLEDPEHVQRFLREAEATSAVQTDHVVRVLDTGCTAAGAPYLVMELLEGHDLGWHLRKTGRLPLHSVVHLVDQVARALAAVRDSGIVHRDLKPGNLFLSDSIPRIWKVLDFGLSKILGATQITHDLAIGTPSYMSPEQVRNAEVDHRADLYALSAIAYRALTGSPPFSGDQVAHILYRVLYSQPEHPAQLVKIPVDLELVLAIGLAKRPDDRFQTIEELSDAFIHAAAGELDDETRAHGWSLVKAFPWGSTRQRSARVA